MGKCLFGRLLERTQFFFGCTGIRFAKVLKCQAMLINPN
jgi:hypothetical protein